MIARATNRRFASQAFIAASLISIPSCPRMPGMADEFGDERMPGRIKRRSAQRSGARGHAAARKDSEGVTRGEPFESAPARGECRVAGLIGSAEVDRQQIIVRLGRLAEEAMGQDL